jgi:hypothetical protein
MGQVAGLDEQGADEVQPKTAWASSARPPPCRGSTIVLLRHWLALSLRSSMLLRHWLALSLRSSMLPRHWLALSLRSSMLPRHWLALSLRSSMLLRHWLALSLRSSMTPRRRTQPAHSLSVSTHRHASGGTAEGTFKKKQPKQAGAKQVASQPRAITQGAECASQQPHCETLARQPSPPPPPSY